MNKRLLSAVFAAATLAATGSRAQENSADLEKRVEQLRTEVHQLTELLSRMLEVEQNSRATPPPAAEPAKPAEALELKTRDVTMKFGGYAQFDGRWFEVNSPGDSAFSWRRVRPDIHGKLPNNMTYRIQGDFAGSSAKLVEGWMDWQACEYSKLTFGQFKEPFSLEALQGAANLDFLERSMVVTALAPLFDTGAAASGQLFDNRVEYGVGVFNGRGQNVEENNDDKDLAARVAMQVLQGLYVGANITHGEQDDELRDAAYRSAGRVPFFKYTPNARTDGNRDRYGLDAEWYIGPASVKAEWIKARQDNVFAGSTNENAVFDGFYVMASYFLTGEDKPRNKGLKDVSTGKDSHGAWELVARYDEFNANEGLFDSGLATGTDQARAGTIGLNWYPNPNFRVMWNLVHVKYDDTVTANGKSEDDEDVALMRLQYSL